MHHILKPLFIAAWVITALVAINFGLTAFGWDFFALPMVQDNAANLMNPIKYIVLLAGLISLAKLVMPKDMCDCGCKC